MSLSTKIKELLRPWVQKIRKMLNPVPLWIQLIFIMILLTTAVSVRLVHKDYTSTKELTLPSTCPPPTRFLPWRQKTQTGIWTPLPNSVSSLIMTPPIPGSLTRKHRSPQNSSATSNSRCSIITIQEVISLTTSFI